MADERLQQETDLVLPLGVHAFVLDTTKGNVNVYVGPMKQPLSPKQEVPVVMNGQGRFQQVPLDQAVKSNIVAAKGEYVVLRNPAKDDKRPKFGASSTLEVEILRMGEAVNIPGPTSFAPWPGQVVEVVRGHHLKSNQYLLVRVYDEEAARKNWGQGTIKLVDAAKQEVRAPEPPADLQGANQEVKQEVKQEVRVSEIDPTKLVIGQQLIIKGTEVSFYIPPTGIEVLKDEDRYVREALTLERLEYCLLVDEDGNKRYVRGPEVVFPKPTETFKVNDDGERKSRAYELNEISGIHVKVISGYSDAFGRAHVEGEELFITGRRTSNHGQEEETQIYFPRVEHAILKYGGRTRYHAIAIPPGEARYVMNRLTGVVRLEHGPSMFLPDPRKEIIVKRILSEGEVATYYPGNAKVAQYNERLRKESQEAVTASAMTGLPSYRSGHISSSILADSSAHYASRAADVIERPTKYTPPRTIVLDSEFEGAVQVRPWTGYAVQVVDQAGNRRVEVGPRTVQLAFDERLEVLSLSMGTPKTQDKVLKTVYLRVSNNAVSDYFDVVTADMVPVKVRLKYLVRFEETEKDRWFSIDNYIQNMVDRFRSMVSNHAHSVEVRDFYGSAGDVLRDLILGQKNDVGVRPGFLFEENGMRVYELDVLGAEILDKGVAESLRGLQNDRILNALSIDRSRSQLDLTTKIEENARQAASAKHETVVAKNELLRQEAKMDFELQNEKLEGSSRLALIGAESRLELVAKELDAEKISADVARQKQAPIDEADAAELSRFVTRMIKEAEADQTRMAAIQPQLVGALVALAQTGALNLVAAHLGDLAIIRQQSLGGMFEVMFKDTPIEGLLENLKKLGTAAVASK